VVGRAAAAVRETWTALRPRVDEDTQTSFWLYGPLDIRDEKDRGMEVVDAFQ
jgi:hypothetical protein